MKRVRLGIDAVLPVHFRSAFVFWSNTFVSLQPLSVLQREAQPRLLHIGECVVEFAEYAFRWEKL